MGRIDIALTRTLLYFRRVSDGKEKDPGTVFFVDKRRQVAD